MKSKNQNSNSYPILRLHPKRERSVLNRHPWLYSGAIESVESAQMGDIVQIHGADNMLLGYGHYAPQSSLACRIFAFTHEPIVIDTQFWNTKFTNAWQMRKSFLPLESSVNTNMYRLFNADGDGLPGIIVDVYNNTAVMQLRTVGALTLKKNLMDFLSQELKLQHIYLQYENEDAKPRKFNNDTKEYTAKPAKSELNGEWLLGALPMGQDTIICAENEMQFWVEPTKGQKTGFFIDQRDNRAFARQYAHNRTVLNAFSYTGGYSVACLLGGAKAVFSVDSSKSAIDLCNKNVELNLKPQTEEDANRHWAEVADCFDFLRQVEPDEFDFIILDPPAFTKSAAAVDRAARGYKDLNLKAMLKIASGGLLMTFSCSQHIDPHLFRQIIFAAASDAGRSVRIIKQLGAPPDHPINVYHPEGEYLKGLALVVD